MKTASLIFPNQLFHKLSELLDADRYYFIEESLFFRQYDFHKIKLVFHRSSMKQLFYQMTAEGNACEYIDAFDKLANVKELLSALNEKGYERIIIFDPEDDWLKKRIKRKCLKLGLELVLKDNPQFINTKQELASFFKPSKKKFFQTTFYKEQRVSRQILINDNNEPLGGKWTYDSENRKKYPRGKTPPKVNFPSPNDHWKEAKEYVESKFPDNPGNVDLVVYPSNHREAELWLTQFLKERFEEFGPYEDAIVSREIFLNHSLLSPLINVGLLKPMEVIKRAVSFASKNDIPINSLEGFVRQILGWREFVRGMYMAKSVESRNTNFWGFQRKMPDCFYTGNTGMPPVDDTINKLLDTGYCHHIERLMVLGNFMLLCEIEPNEVYQWFMELFIDAYDWVMVPNVYGMSQFADGGLFATKPYISGSNYILKMSDYKKGEWQKTWDGLFWRFMHINRNFFLNNPRLSMLVRMFDKMSEEKKQVHLKNA
jgi:deoxyribodipyrimidine photolyase-related protein